MLTTLTTKPQADIPAISHVLSRFLTNQSVFVCDNPIRKPLSNTCGFEDSKSAVIIIRYQNQGCDNC